MQCDQARVLPFAAVYNYSHKSKIIRWQAAFGILQRSKEPTTCNHPIFIGFFRTNCNTPQHTASHYITLQHDIDSEMLRFFLRRCNTLHHTALHCNILHHTARHCNTLQHTTIHCNILQHTATHYNTLHHITTHCNTLQHTTTHCNTLQLTATHCNLT